MIAPLFGASAPPSDAITNNATPVRSIRRWPNRAAAPAQEQQSAEAEQVGVDHPREEPDANTQIARDRWQGDIEHCVINVDQ